MTDPLVEELRAALGERGLLHSPEDRARFETGWRYGKGTARCVARPAGPVPGGPWGSRSSWRARRIRSCSFLWPYSWCSVMVARIAPGGHYGSCESCKIIFHNYLGVSLAAEKAGRSGQNVMVG